MAKFFQDQILDAIKATLVAANTAAAGRVRVEGVDVRGAAQFPAIEIDAGDEEVQLLTLGGRQRREFRVEIRAVIATTGDDYRAQASSLHQQIEQALHSQNTTPLSDLGGERIRLLGIRAGKDGESNRVVYVMRSMWQCSYITKEGAA